MSPDLLNFEGHIQLMSFEILKDDSRAKSAKEQLKRADVDMLLFDSEASDAPALDGLRIVLTLNSVFENMTEQIARRLIKEGTFVNYSFLDEGVRSANLNLTGKLIF